VQPNIPLQDKWNPDLRDINLQILLDLSENAWDSDILVWPEAALPLTTLGASSSNQLLSKLETHLESESSLITGRLVYDSVNRRFHNNVIGLGEASGEYSKRQLVPFGEYVPLENQLRGLIEFFDLPMSVISSGDLEQDLLQAGELSIAIALCYEIAYGEQVAKDSRDANLLVTVSNDTWFGDSIGPHQHFQIAQIRARETGKPVLRGTNNGITGVINSRGQATATSEQFVPTSLTTQVVPYTGTTPYARWGETPIVVLILWSLILLISLRR
jgi:apolipoprotein N-acyltransferase